nr:antitoxin VapB family protein [Halomicrobium urmianum]
MGTKTIGITEEVYEKLKARKRDDESFAELLDRLVDESTADWREGFGLL